MATPQGAQRVELPADGFIGCRQLLKIVPFSFSTLTRRCADGSFPAPVKISPRRNAWPVAAVRDWIESRSVKNV